MLKKLFFCFLFVFISLSVFAQKSDGFKFLNVNKRSDKINFKLVNNLIIIPINFNGVQLSFLLDSGVNKTLLLGVEVQDSSLISEYEKVKVIGLGKESQTYAYKTQDNSLQIGEAVNNKADVYLLLEEEFELGSKIGVPVHGIIGYDFFKDFILRINYKQKTIKLYNPEKFKRKLSRYQKLPLQFHNNKAYLQVGVEDETIEKDYLNLLFDTGSGDSFWLFAKDEIIIPEESFDDVIGYGIASVIEGKRSLIQSIFIGDVKIVEPKVAYPNMQSIFGSQQIKFRDGSIGSEVLKRFKLFVDYPNRHIYFKPNSNLRDPFNYDMSGLLLKYAGYKVIEKKQDFSYSNEIEINQDNILEKIGVKTEFLPILEVLNVRKNSPADKADIRVGDVVLSIDKKSAYRYTIDDLQDLFSEKDGKIILLQISRDGKKLNRVIQLKNRLNRFKQ